MGGGRRPAAVGREELGDARAHPPVAKRVERAQCRLVGLGISREVGERDLEEPLELRRIVGDQIGQRRERSAAGARRAVEITRRPSSKASAPGVVNAMAITMSLSATTAAHP